MSTYDIGDTLRLSATFTLNSTNTAPTAIYLYYQAPGSTTVEYSYGGGTVSTGTGTGVYQKDITIATAGTHHYRWQGTGAVATAEQSSFEVREQTAST